MTVSFEGAARLLRAAAVLTAAATAAAASEDGVVSAPGVNPKDNVTKAEFLVKWDAYDPGSIQSVTAKYDRAFSSAWGGNVEVPLIRFDRFGLQVAGLGDIQVRARWIGQAGPVAVVAALGLVADTASDDVLGRRKWQLNPVGGVVYPISSTVFAFAGYKHFVSVAGDDARADINESQPRVIVGHTAPTGWWLLGDAKCTASWERRGAEVIDLEVEYGRMVARDVGIWLRAGTALLDSDKTVRVNLGIRRIW